jgi:2-dehydro-3-deoxyglucarate aldolase/4-hydroxy-2-oxoheptanedioate aldolase
LLTAARAESTVPVVRLHAAARHLISVALDAGAAGVMVAMVDDAGDAEAVVRAARFPPAGRRGFGLVYPDQLADGVGHAIEAAEAETVVILQIETLAGLEHVEQIAATPGVDVLWLGQYDLTVSLGVPGVLDDPRLREAEERVAAACADAGITAGVLVGDVETARSMLDRRFRMIALGTDINLYGQALRSGLAALRPEREH